MNEMPILLQTWSQKKMEAYKDLPKSIPMELVEPYRDQAYRNHGQTLERLAERGGLSPKELYCLMKGVSLRQSSFEKITNEMAKDFILSLVV